MLSGIGSTDGGRVGSIRISGQECVCQTLTSIDQRDGLSIDSAQSTVGPPGGHRAGPSARTSDHKGVKVQPQLSIYISIPY